MTNVSFTIQYNINSILDEVNPIKVEGLDYGLWGLMFVNDTIITTTSCEDLANKLDSIKSWMTNNQMEINPAKCGVMEINTEEYCHEEDHCTTTAMTFQT